MKTASFPRMHVSLYVSNIEATISFYNTFFGQPASKIKPGYAKYVLDAPSLIISFVQNPARVQSHFGHLGFQVETPAQLQQRLAAAEAAGLVQRQEIGTNCCYAKQDKFWVNDPDGVEWEVYYFHEDAEFNDPHYDDLDAAGASSQCCIAPPPAEKLVTAPMTFTLADTAAPTASACCATGSNC
ncbi:ArsI/CadI family heavy metal resistance metalloenzyme [Solirubrum puertoriconensis]|uniref:VOC domain-containing protein n=1 Tax=Solirubrum puertoriconensis TaxID=1751427 RepID=A0A9X0L6K2_SOLP1|nr:ArsI/CadI family heavy metal resistance metalloenzyme [Solirubrum puertoriconensis]KUG09830.1 hypothetical protein ASU33_19365 [Solirubrum puertoriconensis]